MEKMSEAASLPRASETWGWGARAVEDENVSEREDTLGPSADPRCFLICPNSGGRVESKDDICLCSVSSRRKLGTGGRPQVTSPASRNRPLCGESRLLAEHDRSGVSWERARARS